MRGAYDTRRVIYDSIERRRIVADWLLGTITLALATIGLLALALWGMG